MWFTPRVCGEIGLCRCRKPCITRFTPRVCGEIYVYQGSVANRAGSPPRVRGNLTGRTVGFRPPSVHPRVCGEISLHEFFGTR